MHCEKNIEKKAVQCFQQIFHNIRRNTVLCYPCVSREYYTTFQLFKIDPVYFTYMCDIGWLSPLARQTQLAIWCGAVSVTMGCGCYSLCSLYHFGNSVITCTIWHVLSVLCLNRVFLFVHLLGLAPHDKQERKDGHQRPFIVAYLVVYILWLNQKTETRVSYQIERRLKKC